MELGLQDFIRQKAKDNQSEMARMMGVSRAYVNELVKSPRTLLVVYDGRSGQVEMIVQSRKTVWRRDPEKVPVHSGEGE